MKNLIAGIAVLMFVGQAHSGSYNFECSALRVSSEGQIQKLQFNREEGALNDLGFSIISDNDLLDGDLEFLLKKRTVKANVQVKSIIKDYQGAIGPREHLVKAFVAEIKITDGKRVSKYTGTCVEETVTTCGGDCGAGQ